LFAPTLRETNNDDDDEERQTKGNNTLQNQVYQANKSAPLADFSPHSVLRDCVVDRRFSKFALKKQRRLLLT
jgi:hypothetical protein